MGFTLHKFMSKKLFLQDYETLHAHFRYACAYMGMHAHTFGMRVHEWNMSAHAQGFLQVYLNISQTKDSQDWALNQPWASK